jgi:predicted outer membrane repeat protein
MSSPRSFNISDCIFNNNFATVGGGAISWENRDCPHYIRNVIFINNKASENYGNDMFGYLEGLEYWTPDNFINICSDSLEPRVESRYYDFDELVNNRNSCFIQCNQKVFFLFFFLFTFIQYLFTLFITVYVSISLQIAKVCVTHLV